MNVSIICQPLTAYRAHPLWNLRGKDALFEQIFLEFHQFGTALFKERPFFLQ